MFLATEGMDLKLEKIHVSLPKISDVTQIQMKKMIQVKAWRFEIESLALGVRKNQAFWSARNQL